MKTWKQLNLMAIVAIIAIAFAFIACDNDNGDTHTHEWEWKVTTHASYNTDGLETETCKTCGANNGTRPIPHPSPTEFTVSFDFQTPGYNFNATIKDERTACGSQNLEQLGIVTIIEDTIMDAFTNAPSGVAGAILKGIFRRVFLVDCLVIVPDFTISSIFPIIIIDNNADYESYKLDNALTLRLNIDYLSDATDLESIITTAVREMSYPGRDLSNLPNGFWFQQDGMITGNTIISSLYLTIPSIIKEIPVTAISRYAFYQNDFIIGVTIPNGITMNSDSHFAECSNLASVTFEGGINVDEIYYNSRGIVFDGDLLYKYKTGGKGTYTTTRTGDGNDFNTAVWTKQ